MQKKTGALVISICVITYNSSSTIIETLDSILNQTYGAPLIELIISDDASKDDTIHIISDWLNHNSVHFYSTTLNEQSINSGITKNCNAAWKLSTGEWIKTIAGDDILECDCILDNVNFIHEKTIKSVVFSKMQSFKVDHDGCHKKINILPSNFQQKMLKSDQKTQYKYLLKAEGFSVAPSSFINRGLLAKLNFADERFTMIEDYPLWIKVLEKGEQFFFLDKVTVKYRIGESVSHSSMALFNINHVILRFMIDLEINRTKIDFITKSRKLLHFFIIAMIYLFFGNKKNKFSYILYGIALLVKPYWLKDRLYNYMNKKRK